MNPQPTTRPGLSDERKRFEQWIERELNYGYDLSGYDEAVGYKHEPTNDMWTAWQAALASVKAQEPDAQVKVIPNGWIFSPVGLGAFQHKETGELANILTDPNTFDEWEDVLIVPMAKPPQPEAAEAAKCVLCGGNHESCDSPGALVSRTTGCPKHDEQPAGDQAAPLCGYCNDRKVIGTPGERCPWCRIAELGKEYRESQPPGELSDIHGVVDRATLTQSTISDVVENRVSVFYESVTQSSSEFFPSPPVASGVAMPMTCAALEFKPDVLVCFAEDVKAYGLACAAESAKQVAGLREALLALDDLRGVFGDPDPAKVKLAWEKCAAALSHPQAGAPDRVDDVGELVNIIEAAGGWISATPHGDNCFLSNHYEGDPGNRCNCGKDDCLKAIDAILAKHAEGG